MATFSYPCAVTVTSMRPGPVGRITARARPSKVGHVVPVNGLVLFGSSEPRPARTPGPLTETVRVAWSATETVPSASASAMEA